MVEAQAVIILCPLVNGILRRINSLITSEISFARGFRRQLSNLQGMMGTVQGVLLAAEERQGEIDGAVREWLEGLRDILYVVDDLLDDISTENLRSEGKNLHVRNQVSKSFSIFIRMMSKSKLADRFRDVNKRLAYLTNEIGRFNFLANQNQAVEDADKVKEHVFPSIYWSRVVGRDDERKDIISFLTENHSKKAVVTISGDRGVGKTTLAKLVFHDEKVRRHFDPLIWYDNLDLNAISKDVRQQLQGELVGKKPLVVLDDVNCLTQAQCDELRDLLKVGVAGVLIATTDQCIANMVGESFTSCDEKGNEDEVLRKPTQSHDEGIRRRKWKEQIMEFLLDNCDEKLSIRYKEQIMGHGNSLLKSICEDKSVKRQFEYSKRVSVSCEEFNLKKIVECILEDVDSDKTLEWLQLKLRKQLQQKKFLLVLEDMSDMNPYQRDKLCGLLMNDRVGNKVLITTRNKQVALVPDQTNQLEPLYRDKRMHLEPLFVNHVYEKGNSILMDIMNLHFDSLPSSIKICFMYSLCFSVHPPSREKLTQQWIAQGFIDEPSGDNKRLADVASKYFGELVSRSFFYNLVQDDFMAETRFEVHDIVRDLAHLVSKGECSVTSSDEIENIPCSVHHVAFLDGSKEEFPSSLKRFEKLRTFKCENFGSLSTTTLNVPPFFRSLRVLDLSCSVFHELTSRIDELKHLRYLDLSGNTYLERLPSSLFKLYSLETLRVDGCSIEELPREIMKLQNLRNLYACTEQGSISEGGICGLTSLRILHLDPIYNLKKLPKEMENLTALETLVLKFCSTLELLESDMEGLTSLRSLTITHLRKQSIIPRGLLKAASLSSLGLFYCVGLTLLPEWLEELQCLRRLCVEFCPNLTASPKGICLPSGLQYLSIRGCPELIRRCEGEDRPKISHIGEIRLEGKIVLSESSSSSSVVGISYKDTRPSVFPSSSTDDTPMEIATVDPDDPYFISGPNEEDEVRIESIPDLNSSTLPSSSKGTGRGYHRGGFAGRGGGRNGEDRGGGRGRANPNCDQSHHGGRGGGATGDHQVPYGEGRSGGDYNRHYGGGRGRSNGGRGGGGDNQHHYARGRGGAEDQNNYERGRGGGRGRGGENPWHNRNNQQQPEVQPQRPSYVETIRDRNNVETQALQVQSQRPLHPEPTPKHNSASHASVLNMQELRISEKDLPLSSVPMNRPDNGGTASICLSRLLVNHFPVRFNPHTIIKHYYVDIKPEVPSKKGRPVRIPKDTLRMIRNKFSSDNPSLFPLSKSAFDSEKIIYSITDLPTGIFKVDFSEAEDRSCRTYVFTIKLVNELRLGNLSDYLTGKIDTIPRDILQGLDIVMKENPTRHMVQVGRGFYPGEGDPDGNLRSGIIASRGFQHGLRATSQGLAMCMDYTVLAFRKRMPVLDFLSEHLPGFSVNDFRSWSRKVEHVLRDLKVTVIHRPTKQKFRIAGLTKENARESTFVIEDPNGTEPPRHYRLIDFYREKYGRDIVHQDIPCLQLGKNNRRNDVPMELCVLVEGQRYPKEALDRNAALLLKGKSLAPPIERKNIINAMIKAENGPCGGGIAQNFGLDVNPNMTRVVGRILEPPELKLGATNGRVDRVTVDREKCQWNLVGKAVVEAKPIDRWAVIDFSAYERRDRLNPYTFIPELIARCGKLGMRLAEPLVYRSARMNFFSNVTMLREILDSVKSEAYEKNGARLQIILCVMAAKHEGYKFLKWISETEIGIITQCCLSERANKANDQYLANLALKINAKLGGSNVELKERLPRFETDGSVMFIGADVNHPAASNKSSPSIAAVVATLNWPGASRYAARVCPQEHRKEKIMNFGEICWGLVGTYARINNQRPHKIVVFRDGVSGGQFDMVLNEELLDLRKTFMSAGYNPTITLVVAKKRHHTRFFPETQRDGSRTGNMLPGTVVDTVVVNPHEFDFYLCSHYGIIGTSKPTHYHVLWDEHGFSSDQLQKLIYYLCFTFARCTKPVSLVTPVYYADLVAYRGRLYYEAMVESQSPGSVASSSSSKISSKSSTGSFNESFFKLHGELENIMFFI